MKSSGLALLVTSALLVESCTDGRSVRTPDEAKRPSPEVGQEAPVARAPEPDRPDGLGAPRPVASITPEAERALAWLAAHQLPDGGFGQGDESAQMAGSLPGSGQESNVGDTSAAALALLRSGSTPSSGPYARNLRLAVERVLQEVERAPAEGLAVTSLQGTRLQAKLGRYVDTFLASILLAEVWKQMPTKEETQRVGIAIDKVLTKIASNQRADGTWEGHGWAPVLSQGLAAKGLNRAKQAGAEVPDAAIDRSSTYSQSQFDGRTGKFSGEGSAGVELYASSANLGSISDSVATYAAEEAELEEKAANGTAEEKAEAKRRLAQIAAARDAELEAQSAVVARLRDDSFLAGFGSNGGEEFLSYLSISESLLQRGGKTWDDWNRGMADNMKRIQNADGSFTGHHCITGRTFCTAAALLVLTADRSPVPVTAKLRRGSVG